jgi:hypothetical protein
MEIIKRQKQGVVIKNSFSRTTEAEKLRFT